MSGIECLLDTNIVIGILKDDRATIDLLLARGAVGDDSALCSISRVELLSKPEMDAAEEAKISGAIGRLTVLPLTRVIEDKAILLRRSRRMKLPDAIIAATALVHELELITHDVRLASAFAEASKP